MKINQLNLILQTGGKNFNASPPPGIFGDNIYHFLTIFFPWISSPDPEGYCSRGSQHCEPEKSHQGQGSSPESGSNQALRQILQAQRRALQG